MFAGRPPALLLGVPIDDLTMVDCLDALGDLVQDGRAHGRTHQVATVNVDFLVNAVDDPELHSLLQSTSLNLADGLPLVWGSRLAGCPVRERVAGADLVPLLAAESERRGWRVHFFGSAPGVVERALDKLRKEHPGAQLSGESGPMMRDVTRLDDELLDGLAARDADILCVALGNPKQEWFIDSNLERVGCPVAIGIGGSLDMLVGDRTRAPQWAQRIGAEWIVRAAQEPKRLGPRYARDAVVFGPKLAQYVRELRNAGDMSLAVQTEGNRIVVTHVAADTRSEGPPVGQPSAGDPSDPPAVHLELGQHALTATAVFELVGIVRRARTHGRPVTHAPIRGELRAQLDRLSVLPLLDTPSARSVT